MSAQSWRIGRVIACSALSFSLLASPVFVGVAAAQQTPANANAAPANLSARDAAIDATRKGDYVAALDFAKKAAAAGQPLDAEQVEFIAGKAEKQQAQRDAEAKGKATQVAAAATAQQIMERQQKDYADRAARAEASKKNAAQCAQQANIAGTLMTSLSSAQGQGIGMIGQGGAMGQTPSSTGASPISAERCGG